MSIFEADTARAGPLPPSTNNSDSATELICEFMGLADEMMAAKVPTDCGRDAAFWEDFLQRAAALAGAATADWNEWQNLINDLSPEIIAGLPEQVRTRWSPFHNRYLDFGGTSEGMLDGLLLGITEAWNKCSERYQPLIRSQLARYCRVPYDMEEVTQDVLVRLDHVLRKEEFKRERHGSFRKCLTGVIFYVIREYERRNRDGSVAFVSVLTEWASDVDDINSIVMREWHDALINSLLEAVEAHFRRIQETSPKSTAMRDFGIFLAYTLPKWRGEKCPASQIADRFHVSLSVVYGNDGKMRALCRRLLEAQGWDADL